MFLYLCKIQKSTLVSRFCSVTVSSCVLLVGFSRMCRGWDRKRSWCQIHKGRVWGDTIRVSNLNLFMSCMTQLVILFICVCFSGQFSEIWTYISFTHDSQQLRFFLMLFPHIFTKVFSGFSSVPSSDFGECLKRRTSHVLSSSVSLPRIPCVGLFNLSAAVLLVPLRFLTLFWREVGWFNDS